jgi:hypothetical protein
MIKGLDRAQLSSVIGLAHKAIYHDRSVTRINLPRMRQIAKTLTDGKEILDFLEEEEVRDRLFQAAQDGEPVFLCISDDLVAKFGPQVWTEPVQQFIYEVCYAIMKEERYLPTSSIREDREDVVFAPRDIFFEKVGNEEGGAEILWAMICGLEEQQLLHLISLADGVMNG